MNQLRIALLFFSTLKEVIHRHNTDHYILCGHFNLVQNPKLDTDRYKHINNPRARLAVLDMINELELIGIKRHLHQDTHRNTWRKKNPVKQARLD